MELKKNSRTKRRVKNYKKEEDPHYFPPGWEEDCIEVRFINVERPNQEYKATIMDYDFVMMDKEVGMVPKKIVQHLNENCRIYERDKKKKDPKTPARFVKNLQRYEQRVRFEPINFGV